MQSYLLYGLRVLSEIQLPLRATATTSGDVTVRFERVGPASLATAIVQGSNFKVTEEGTFLFVERVGTLLISNGCEIRVDPVHDCNESQLQATILGTGMATILHQRGRLTLHASAVAVDNQALLLIGESGKGKSTLAMEFYARGYELIADEITLIEFRDGNPVVFPSYPLIRADESLVESLSDRVLLRTLGPSFDKQLVSVADRFVMGSRPLGRIYVLDTGESHRIESLSPQDALVELIRHTYPIRLLRVTDAPSHLYQCAQLVNTTAIKRITIGRNEDSQETARLVEDDFSSRERLADNYYVSSAVKRV